VSRFTIIRSGVRRMDAANRPCTSPGANLWLGNFEVVVSRILAQTARAAGTGRGREEMGESNMVGTVIHALSIDPPIRRDAFFMYLMTEVPAPAPWPDGLHTCLRLQHAPVSVQRAVVAAFAVEAPKLTAATRMKCLAAMHRRISDVIILSFLERGDLLRPNTTSVNGIVEASSRKSAFALEGTSLLEDFTRTRSLVGMQPSLAADDVESIPRQGEVSCDVAKEDHRIIERAEEGESPGRELNNECDDTRRDGKRARTVLPEGAVVCTSSVEASLASPQKSKHRGTAAAAAGSQAEHVVTGEGQLCRDATEDALSAKDEAIIARYTRSHVSSSLHKKGFGSLCIRTSTSNSAGRDEKRLLRCPAICH